MNSSFPPLLYFELACSALGFLGKCLDESGNWCVRELLKRLWGIVYFRDYLSTSGHFD